MLTGQCVCVWGGGGGLGWVGWGELGAEWGKGMRLMKASGSSAGINNILQSKTVSEEYNFSTRK